MKPSIMETKDLDIQEGPVDIPTGPLPCSSCSICPGFTENGTWRKVCQHCRCNVESHRLVCGDRSDISQLVRDFQRQCGSSSDNDSGCALEEYAWVPAGLTSEQVHQYFANLPEREVPYITSEGEQHRLQQLLWQLPPQDSKEEYCRALGPQEQEAYREYNLIKQKEALGRGTVKVLPLTTDPQSCNRCKGSIGGGDMAVLATQFCSQDANSWHPRCFRCSVCEEHLVDLIYFYKEGEIYCGRHYAETSKPRCEACDELIFSEECTEAEDRCWHVDHFCCFQCQGALGGQRYVMQEGRPYCTCCFEQLFAQQCAFCAQPIQVDQGQMTHEGQHWHATADCFHCLACKKPLLKLPFLPIGGATFCSEQCSKDVPTPAPRAVSKENDKSSSPSLEESDCVDYDQALQPVRDLLNANSHLPSQSSHPQLSVQSISQRTIQDMAFPNPPSVPAPLDAFETAQVSSSYKSMPFDTRSSLSLNGGHSSLVGHMEPFNGLPQGLRPHGGRRASLPAERLHPQPPSSSEEYSDDEVPPLPTRHMPGRGLASSHSFTCGSSGYDDSQRSSRSSKLQHHIDMVNHRYQKRVLNSEGKMDPITRPSSNQQRFMVSSASVPSNLGGPSSRPSSRRRTKRRSRTRGGCTAQPMSMSTQELFDERDEGACSTCSSGSDTDWEDEEYSKEVLRSHGLRISYVDGELVTPVTSKAGGQTRRAKHHKKGNCAIM